jgi:hypothetical protein
VKHLITWDVTSCSPEGTCRRFGGTYYGRIISQTGSCWSVYSYKRWLSCAWLHSVQSRRTVHCEMHRLDESVKLRWAQVPRYAYQVSKLLVRAFKNFFTFECCILLRIYLTGSLWRRQSQQSFNTLTPFNFLFYSLHVSAPTGHLQVRYTIRYSKGYFLIQRIRCTYAIWCRNVICCRRYLTCSPNTCYRIKYNNKNCKISKIPRY